MGPGTASAIGTVAVSPTALLGVLETAFGLAGPTVSLAERAAWLMPRLQATEGFWSASFAVDGWGTAVRLISDRDALVMHGWRGEPVSKRWDSLWAVAQAIAPGVRDRWAAVLDAVGTRAIELTEIVLVDPLAHWPGAIARVLAALGASGVTLRDEARAVDPTIAIATDLAAARGERFVATADGSLQLVRAQGAAGAAEDIAAWLAEHGDLRSTMIVSPDATLDAALHRAGLPTTGAGSAAHGTREA